MPFIEPQIELITLLKANISASVYASDAPIRAPLPVCIVFVAENEQTLTSLCNSTENEMTVEIWAMASTYAGAWAVAREIQTLVHGYSDEWMLVEGPKDEGVEALDEKGDVRVYSVSLSFTCSYDLTS